MTGRKWTTNGPCSVPGATLVIATPLTTVADIGCTTPCPAGGRTLCLAELEKLHRITGPYAVSLRLRDVGVDFVEERPRIGPFALDVREIGGEHDAVHTHMLSQFNRHALVLHGEIDVLPHVVAG